MCETQIYTGINIVDYLHHAAIVTASCMLHGYMKSMHRNTIKIEYWHFQCIYKITSLISNHHFINYEQFYYLAEDVHYLAEDALTVMCSTQKDYKTSGIFWWKKVAFDSNRHTIWIPRQLTDLAIRETWKTCSIPKNVIDLTLTSINYALGTTIYNLQTHPPSKRKTDM